MLGRGFKPALKAAVASWSLCCGGFERGETLGEASRCSREGADGRGLSFRVRRSEAPAPPGGRRRGEEIPDQCRQRPRRDVWIPGLLRRVRPGKRHSVYQCVLTPPPPPSPLGFAEERHRVGNELGAPDPDEKHQPGLGGQHSGRTRPTRRLYAYRPISEGRYLWSASSSCARCATKHESY